MAPRKAAFDTVRELGLALPDVEEGTAYGSPALKIRGNLLACIAINKSAEPDTLAVRVPFDERDRLIDEEPLTYYVTDHYVEYPCVLVRLRKVHRDALRDLLGAAWTFVSAQKPARKRATSTHSRRSAPSRSRRCNPR